MGRGTPAPHQRPAAGVPVPPANGEKEPVAKVTTDALGDPLPAGALKRLGTRRHRVQDWPLGWFDLPDGKSYLAHQRTGSRDEIRRVDADTGRVLETWPVPDKHHAIGYSPDGRYVLMATGFIFYTGFQVPGQKYPQEWVLTLYDLEKRKTVWANREQLEQNEWKNIDAACFSRDGKWVVTTGRSGQGAMRLWDATTGKEVWNRKPGAVLEPVGFTDGGNAVVACGNNDRNVYVIDRATGKDLRSFPTVPANEFQGCTVSPDGASILFGRYGPTIRVWELATGKERPPLEGHKQWARRVAFSRDGKTLVTGGNDPFVLVRN